MEVVKVWMSHSGSTHSDESGEGSERQLNAPFLWIDSRVPMDHCVVYNPDKQVSQLKCKHPRTGDIESNIVVVSIDGTCNRKGCRPPRATWAVSFGVKSPYSSSGLLGPSFPQTSIIAQIEALAQAIRTIQFEFADDDMIEGFLIRTDLDFLVGEMSDWVEAWVRRMDNPLRTIQFSGVYGDNEGLDSKL